MMKGLGIDPAMMAQLTRQLGGRNPMEALAGMASGGGGKNNPFAALAPDLNDCKALQTAMMPEMGPSVVFGPGVSELDDISRWTIIYPHYLDSERTRKQGRKMERGLCLPKPDVAEMAEAATQIGLRCVLERDKCYPRDFLVRGRVRVETKDPLKGETKFSKTELMELMVSVMHDLETRKQRLAAEAAEAAAAQAPPASTKQTPKATTKASATKGGAAAKGKKKKK